MLGLSKRLKGYKMALFAPLLMLAWPMTALSASLPACAPQASSHFADEGQLLAHKPVQQEVSRGAANSYQISLDSGQYIRLRLNHSDVGMSISLYSPDDHKIVEYYCYDKIITCLSAIADTS